ncbi:MAG TPA: hypothetical protein VF179_26800 [Thermoanaerobaculia bacterium]|nr:hypothetical protein [Thermoanaerobaculia bacterium]
MTLPPLADVLRLLASLAGIVGVAAGLLWGCGLLVARPLLPRRYHPVLPFVAPFLGFSLVSAVAHYAGAAGASLRSVLWLFVGLAVAGWVTVFLDRRLRRFPRSSVPALVICLLAFLLAAAPLLVLGYLTTLGGTIDGVSYAVRSEYLQGAPPGLPDIEAGKPYLGWVRSQIDLLRLGDVYLVGLLGLLTGKRSYELLTVVPALFFALTAGSVYVLARSALGLCRRAALLAAALVGVHNLLLWPVYDNFLSQAIAHAFLPVVLAFGIEAQRRSDWRMAAVFAILSSGLASVYPMYAARTLAAVLFFWGLAWLFRPRGPRLRALGRAALWWGGVVAAVALWNGFALARSVSELGLLSGALSSSAVKSLGPGNILVFPAPEEVFGLIAHPAAAYGTDWLFVPLRVLIALGLACAGLAAHGWWRLSPRARLATAALLLTSAALVAQQRWGAGYPYGYFKVLTTVVAEVMILVAAGIVALWRGPHDGARNRAVRRWLAAIGALLLLALNLKHTLWTQSYVLENALMVDQDLIDMGRAASRVDADSWILLDMKASIRQHWLGSLLRDQKIRFRDPLWMGHVDTPGAANAFFRYAVVEKSLDEQQRGTALGDPWYDPAAYGRLAGNGRYELRERRDTTLGSIRWDRRWPEQTALELALASSGTLSARLGPEAKEAGVGSGRPRTLQVRVYGLSPSSQLEVAGLGAPFTLDPGGWLLDVDLGCVAGGRMGITQGAGDVVLSEVRILAAVTGRPGVCLERVPLPTGMALIEQDDLGDGRIRLRTAVLRPQGAGEHHYRLGFHVIEVSLGKLFGVWSLDFAADEQVQHGSLEIDLRNRSSRGEIDGRPVDVGSSNFDHDAGSFEADAVWWQFNPLAQIEIERMLWFERDGHGAVWVSRAVPGAQIEVLAAP